MSGFSNPVVAGGILQVPAIESTNFVSGVRGWRIARNGDAQFNNATFIGSITVLNGNEIVIYNGAAPALGNIIMALSPAAGSDTAGNTWGPGFTLFDGTTGATVVNFGANTGFEFLNPDNLVGIDLTVQNVPIFIESSATADASIIKGVHGAVYATTETLELMASTNSVATDSAQSVIILKLTESNGLNAADARFDYQNTGGTTTLLKLTNGTVAIPVALAVTGKTTMADMLTINSADANGSIHIAQTVSTTGNPGTISQQESASGNGAYGVYVNGDAHARFVLRASGQIEWSNGTNAHDTTLSRETNGGLNVAVSNGNNGFSVTNSSAVTGAVNADLLLTEINGTAQSFGIIVNGDTNLRLLINSSGKITWGSGSGATDLNLYRSSAGLLKTDNSLEVGTNLTVDGTSTLTGNSTVGGTLGVTGATTLSSTLAAGATTITGAATVSTTLSAGTDLQVNSVSVGRGIMAAALTSTSNSTTTSGTTETFDAVLGFYQFTAVSGRRYMAYLTNSMGSSNVANDLYLLRIRDSGSGSNPTSASTAVALTQWLCVATGGGGQTGVTLQGSFVSGSSGTHTLGVSATRIAGTGVFNFTSGNLARQLFVVDLGAV